jgi:hypothetical protein
MYQYRTRCAGLGHLKRLTECHRDSYGKSNLALTACYNPARVGKRRGNTSIHKVDVAVVVDEILLVHIAARLSKYLAQ